MPAASAKASISELRFKFAKAYLQLHQPLKVLSGASFVCPLRCQHNRAHGQNNGVGLTKMLTAK